MSELDDFVENTDVTETEIPTETPVTETGETDAASPAADKSTETQEQTMVPLAAKQAEKERRIKAERELEALRSQQTTETPDIFDKPDVVLNNLKMGLKAEMSEALVRDQHDDYDQIMDHYEDMVKANPAIHAEIMNAALPASKAYKMAKNDMEMKEMGDVSTFKEKMRQEIMAELKAEKQAPPDLTTARSASIDPATIEEIPDGTEGLNKLLGR